MEKELAGSNSSLSSVYRQWAAVNANLLPINTALQALLRYSARVSSSRRSKAIQGWALAVVAFPLKILILLLGFPQWHLGTQSRDVVGNTVEVNSEVFEE